jgi:predicted nucleic acid-binding protein
VAKRKVARAPGRRATRSRGRPGGDVDASATSLRYIESSALLAALLEHDGPALDALRTDGQRVTSALTFAEASRAIIRARVSGRLSPAEERAALRAVRTFERRCAVVAVTDAVLTRAGRPFPVEPIRTLDAVHLATVEALGESPQLLTLVTRDARVRDNARALGYALA